MMRMPKVQIVSSEKQLYLVNVDGQSVVYDSKKALKRAQKMTTEGLILLSKYQDVYLMTFDQLPIEIKPLVFRCK